MDMSPTTNFVFPFIQFIPVYPVGTILYSFYREGTLVFRKGRSVFIAGQLRCTEIRWKKNNMIVCQLIIKCNRPDWWWPVVMRLLDPREQSIRSWKQQMETNKWTYCNRDNVSLYTEHFNNPREITNIQTHTHTYKKRNWLWTTANQTSI